MSNPPPPVALEQQQQQPVSPTSGGGVPLTRDILQQILQQGGLHHVFSHASQRALSMSGPLEESIVLNLGAVGLESLLAMNDINGAIANAIQLALNDPATHQISVDVLRGILAENGIDGTLRNAINVALTRQENIARHIVLEMGRSQLAYFIEMGGVDGSLATVVLRGLTPEMAAPVSTATPMPPPPTTTTTTTTAAFRDSLRSVLNRGDLDNTLKSAIQNALGAQSGNLAENVILSLGLTTLSNVATMEDVNGAIATAIQTSLMNPEQQLQLDTLQTILEQGGVDDILVNAIQLASKQSGHFARNVAVQIGISLLEYFTEMGGSSGQVAHSIKSEFSFS